jgi:hypothetical protein
MLMHRRSLLDSRIHQFSHDSVRVQNVWFSNTSSPSQWSSTGVYHPSKSNTSRTTKALVLAERLWLLYSNSHLSRTTYSKTGRLLRPGNLQDLGFSIRKHESHDPYHVSLQAFEAYRIEASVWVAIAEAILDLVEIGNLAACRCERSAYEFALRSLLRVCQSVAHLLSTESDTRLGLVGGYYGRQAPSVGRCDLHRTTFSGSLTRLQIPEETAARRLFIPEIRFQDSTSHHPAPFRQMVLSHYWGPHDAQVFKTPPVNHSCDLPRQVAGGHVSFENFVEGGIPLLRVSWSTM